MTQEEYRASNLFFHENGAVYLIKALDLDSPIIEPNEEGWIKESVRQLLRRVEPKSVLEIGYGRGYTAALFQETGVRHTIVEPHPQILERITGQSEVIPDFVENVDFAGRRFDLIYNDIWNSGQSNVKALLPKIDHDWYAPCALAGISQGTGFWFTHNDKHYWQELYENHHRG